MGSHCALPKHLVAQAALALAAHVALSGVSIALVLAALALCGIHGLVIVLVAGRKLPGRRLSGVSIALALATLALSGIHGLVVVLVANAKHPRCSCRALPHLIANAAGGVSVTALGLLLLGRRRLHSGRRISHRSLLLGLLRRRNVGMLGLGTRGAIGVHLRLKFLPICVAEHPLRPKLSVLRHRLCLLRHGLGLLRVALLRHCRP